MITFTGLSLTLIWEKTANCASEQFGKAICMMIMLDGSSEHEWCKIGYFKKILNL